MNIQNMAAKLNPKFPMAANRPSIVVNFNARKLDGNEYLVEHALGLKIHDKDEAQLFQIDLVYRGIFDVDLEEGPSRDKFILIDGARNLFPFIRTIVRNATSDSNHLPLNMANINYERIYAIELQKIAQAKDEKEDAKKAKKKK